PRPSDAGAIRPGPVTSQHHTRPGPVSATYTREPSGDRPTPLGCTCGCTTSVIDEPSGRAYFRASVSPSQSRVLPMPVNNNPPSDSNTMSLGPRSGRPSQEV